MSGESSEYEFVAKESIRAHAKRPAAVTPQGGKSALGLIKVSVINHEWVGKRPLEIVGIALAAISSRRQTRSAVAELREPPALHRPWRGKRALDIVGALAIATMLSPLILGLALWLSLTGGPILFGHPRIGQGGKQFVCYKFCTMVPDADRVLEELFERTAELRVEWILNQKLREDPRITRVGQFLRKASLDELPQLWNVLKGEMSLIGPRPIVREEIFRYGHAYRHYLAVKPGITGLWQISGRNDTGYRRRVALDRIYAMRSSFGLDMRILLQTVIVVVRQAGAY